jgi:hypothetical protein
MHEIEELFRILRDREIDRLRKENEELSLLIKEAQKEIHAHDKPSRKKGDPPK